MHRQYAAPHAVKHPQHRSIAQRPLPSQRREGSIAFVIRFHFPEDAYGRVGQRYSVSNFLGFWNGPHSWCKIDVLP